MNGTKIKVEYGTEGPRFDPWSYTKVTVERLGRKVELHCGISVRMWVDGKEIGKNHEDELYATFELLIGMTPCEAVEYHHRTKYRCRCGCTNLIDQEGYPGETLYICTRCDNIVAADQNMEAVI